MRQLPGSPDNFPPDPIPRLAAARLLNVHPGSVSRRVKAGKLRAWRLLGRVFLSKAEVLAQAVPIHGTLTPEAEARVRAVETRRTLEAAGVK